MFKLASLFVEISGKADPLNATLKATQSSLNATSSAFGKIAKMGGAGVAGGVNALATSVKRLEGASLGGVARDIAMVSGAAGALSGGSFGRTATSVGILANALSKLSGGGGDGGAPAATQAATGLMGAFSRVGGAAAGAVQGVFSFAGSLLGMGSTMASAVQGTLGVIGAFARLAALIPGVTQVIAVSVSVVTTLGGIFAGAAKGVFTFGESFLKLTGGILAGVAQGIATVAGAITKLAGIIAGGIISGVESLAGALGRLAKATIGPVLIAGGAGLAALGYGINRAANAASALNESVSKIGVVFADQTGTVMKLVDKLADSFGLPRRAMVDAASMFGMISTGAGASRQEAAKLSTAMTQLAADAMSFQNVSLEVALEKIRAGLVGESEPLHAWGVMLDEESVKIEGVRLGLAKTGKELDHFGKITARASLITKGMAPAVGDLDRTFSSTENQVRRLSGNIENTLEKVGESFLPLKTLFASLASGTVDKLRAAFMSNKPAIEGFLSGVSDRLTRFHQFMTSAFESAGFSQFASIAVRTFQEFGGALERAVMRGPELFRLFRDAFVNAVGPIATSALNALGIKFIDVGMLADNALYQIEIGLRNLPEYAQIAGLMIREKFQQAATVFTFVKDTAMEAAMSLYGSFASALTSVTDAFRVFWAEVSTFSTTVTSGIVSSVSGMMDAMTGGVIGPAIGVIGAAFSGLGQMISDLFGSILSPVGSAISALAAKLGGTWAKVGDDFQRAMDKIRNAKMPELPNQDKAIQGIKERIAANEKAFAAEGRLAEVWAKNKTQVDAFVAGFNVSGKAAVKVAGATAAGIDKAFHSHKMGLAEYAQDLRVQQMDAVGAAMNKAAAAAPGAGHGAAMEQVKKDQANWAKPGTEAFRKQAEDDDRWAKPRMTLSEEMAKDRGKALPNTKEAQAAENREIKASLDEQKKLQEDGNKDRRKMIDILMHGKAAMMA